MRIGVITATSCKDKNELLYRSVVDVTEKLDCEVVNFGCYGDEPETFSYVEIAVEVCLLLASGSVDFIVTGCSSGQGMMLACNSLPDVICGYTASPQDAFLFGRINNGNAVSLPLGLNFGWAGEINLRCTLEKLFETPFGTGYPPEDADRKKRDTAILKQINSLVKRSVVEVMEQLDKALARKALNRRVVVDYIMQNGSNTALLHWIEKSRAEGGRAVDMNEYRE